MALTGEAAGAAEPSSAKWASSLVPTARSRVGSTLNRKWHLDAFLGVGGMASVYAATHRNGRRAAIKLLHPELSLHREWRDRFLREGRVANAVGHDGAVKVLDDDASDDGLVFLVLELLEGETVRERWHRLGRRLPETEVLWVADQLLDVLVAAHRRGIVHRDIKPDNLFLTSSGSVKVLDFGIARLRELSTASTATSMGGALGTPGFMAPEQARGLGEEVDARSDLFSVGATMFTLLSGRHVHEGRTPNEEMLSAMTIPAAPLSSVVAGVAGTVARLVDGALAFDKAERWPSAQHMQDEVRRTYRDRTGSSMAAAPRLVVPDAVVNAKLGPSRNTQTAPPTLADANAHVESMGSRRTRLALTLGGVAAVAGIGIALVRPGYSNGERLFAGAPPASFVAPSPAAAAAGRSTVVVDAPSPPPEPSAVEAPPPPAAPASAKPPKAPAAPKPAVKAGCATPFVVDPLTHIKHWKVECL